MFFTERLCLRGFQAEDTDKIIAMETDPRVAPNIGLGFWRPAKPNFADEIKKRYETEPWAAVAVTREGGEFIGVIGLAIPSDTPNRNPAMYIGVTPEHWRKGYGGEMLRFLLKHAFIELGMHRVWLQTLDNNLPALALYKDCGFAEEGRLREHVWKGGKWHDVVNMGILKQEWEQRNDAVRASLTANINLAGGLDVSE